MSRRMYTVGFAFNKERDQVALIKKNRPEWQSGYLNGIGGHKEPGETFLQCMAREFKEETGVYIKDWEHFATMEFDEAIVSFYKAFDIDLSELRTTTDEPVVIFNIHDTPRYNKLMYNIPMLIFMALGEKYYLSIRASKP